MSSVWTFRVKGRTLMCNVHWVLDLQFLAKPAPPPPPPSHDIPNRVGYMNSAVTWFRGGARDFPRGGWGDLYGEKKKKLFLGVGVARLGRIATIRLFYAPPLTPFEFKNS